MLCLFACRFHGSETNMHVIIVNFPDPTYTTAKGLIQFMPEYSNFSLFRIGGIVPEKNLEIKHVLKWEW